MSTRSPSADAFPPASAGGLVVRDLTVAYGGNVAVEDVSLSAEVGTITGLIGPNGAGKTSTFNACTGLLRPRTGTVELFGENVTRRGPAVRARMGLGRTFQRMELVDRMSVRTNVALGAECRIVGSGIVRQLVARASERRRIEEATDAALEQCGIADLADRPVGSLSTGRRRLVELARTLAGDFRLLLLDEPSSGLDEEETHRFGRILEAVVAERGIGILLVEHDMALVMAVCRQLSVLDFGKLIFEGTPAEARASEIVRAAYLGDEAVGVA